MKKVFLFLSVVLAVLFSSAAYADQEGNAKWCNMDQYGCYETEADGSTYYIMFWSEAARQAIMGNLTAPYTNVVDYCYNCNGRMGLGSRNGGGRGGNGGSLPGWMRNLRDVIDKHADFLNSSYFDGDAESEYQRMSDFYNEGSRLGVSDEKIVEYIKEDDEVIYPFMESLFH